MNTVNYWVADPTGNITLLIEEPFAQADYPAVAGALLEKEPSAEQAGFIEQIGAGSVTLHMAGGEFCGNASLSAAALAVHIFRTDSGEASPAVHHVDVHVYGIRETLDAEITPVSPYGYCGLLSMPLPEEISEVTLDLAGKPVRLPLVRFPGIGHLILREPVDDADAERAVRVWCEELGLEALGLMQLSEPSQNPVDDPVRRLRPLVYVRGIRSLFWEHSCASGTCAAAVWTAREKGPGRYDFLEPGGTLGAIVGENSLWLAGSVTLMRP